MLLKKNDVINFFVTILISCTSFMGNFVPVSIGFIEARENAKIKKLFFYCVSIIVVMLKFSLETGVYYSINILALLIVLEALDALFIKNTQSTRNAILLVTFFSTVLCEYLDGLLAYDIVLSLAIAFATAMSYILFTNLEFNIYEIDEKGFLLLSAVLGVLLVTLRDFKIYSLILTNILAVYIILNLAYFKGVKFAVIGGLIIGTICEISKPSMGTFIISLTLGGFIASLFNKRGKLETVLGFLLGNSILAYYITGYNTLTSKILEIIVAAVFFFITNKKMNEITNFIIDDVLLLPAGENTTKDYARQLEDTSNTLYNISNVMEKVDIEEGNDICKNIEEDICKGCEKYEKCWYNDFDNTLDTIFSYIDTPGDIDSEALSLVNCDNKGKIINELKHMNYKTEKVTFEDFKKSMVNQIKGISKYISNMASLVKEDSGKNVEERIVKGFERINLPISKVYVNIKDDECEVELKANKNILKSNIEKSNVVLSKVLNKRMLNTDSFGNNFKETEKLKIKIGIASKCKGGQKISGDTYKLIDFLNDKYIMVLSDGMGVGVDAKYISNILVDMFSNMSTNNIDAETITTLISSFANYISKSEKIITLDSTSINLVTGECELIKIGGAPTFIIKKDFVDIICSETLPLGIFEEVDFYKETRTLSTGDIVVSVTDGVIDSKRDIINKEFWVSGFLRKLDIDEPQIIADELLNKTIENYGGKILDDITIIVQKIV